MSASGATRSYQFAQKEHWRNWVWNELERRGVRERSGFIIYLLGPQNNDLTVAVRKKFLDSRLIGIDTDRRNVDRAKSIGLKSIQCDLMDALWSWPKEVRVDAVIADFCSGLNFNSTAVLDPMRRAPFYNAVAAVNYLRGRDADSNKLRLQDDNSIEEVGLPVQNWRKNRAVQMIANDALGLVGTAQIGGHPIVLNRSDAASVKVSITHLWQKAMRAWIAGARPKFHSYASGNLRFDSVVCEPSLALVSNPLWRFIKSQHEREMSRFEASYRVDSLSEKIKAVVF